MSYPKLAGGEYRFSCLVRVNGPSFLSLWQISVTASYVTLVISALRLVLRKLAPRQVICLLLLVLFAQLLLPIPLENPVSLSPNLRRGMRQAANQTCVPLPPPCLVDHYRQYTDRCNHSSMPTH